jgi:hypothetical protein
LTVLSGLELILFPQGSELRQRILKRFVWILRFYQP